MSTTDLSRIVVFRVGEDQFAADIYSVERVLRYKEPTALPNVPDWVEGVLEYQGRVVPVLNLRARFGLPRLPARPETRTLILNVGAEWVGAVVESVSEVTAIEASQIAPPPALFRGLAAEYLRGIVRRDERLVVLLDVERLMSATERLTLEQATAEAARDA